LHLIGSPPLPADEERAYLKLLATASGQEERNEARQVLIDSNLRLVWYVVRRFCRQRAIPLTHEMVVDLFQSGVIGLIHAIDKFDATQYHNRLSTYAVSWIMQAVSREWAQHHRTVVHLPIAITERRGSLPIREYSLDAPLPQTHDGQPRTFGEIIPDACETDPDIAIMITDMLPPSEALVIRLRFGIGLPPMDIPAIARHLQVSQRDVMQMIRTGQERLARCFDEWQEEPDERDDQVDATPVAGECDPSSVV